MPQGEMHFEVNNGDSQRIAAGKISRNARVIL
jgi:hypothetical protein